MTEKIIRKTFLVGLVLKAINAFFEIVGGFLFFFTGSISAVIGFLIQADILGVGSQFFIASYLFLHGIVKLFLVINLFRNKLWAYPATIVFLSIFVVYQIIQVLIGHSFFLTVFTLIDIVILWLTWHEYQLAKKHLPFE